MWDNALPIVFTICPYKAIPVYIKCCWGNLDLVGSGADLDEMSGWGGGLEFSKYASRRTTSNISRFSGLSGVFLLFVLACQTFSARFARLLLYLIRMKVDLCHVTILRQFCLLSRNLKIIFASSYYTFCICAEQPPPWHIPVHSHLVVNVSKYRCMYNVFNISKTAIFLYFFKIW